MLAVMHIPTGRLVYRQQPDFDLGKGIINAHIWTGFPADELVEIEVADSEWQRELALRAEERPVPLEERVAALEKAFIDFESGLR